MWDYYPAFRFSSEENSFYNIISDIEVSNPMASDPFVWGEPELNVLEENPLIFRPGSNAGSLLYLQRCGFNLPTMHPNLVSTLKSFIELDDNYQEKAPGKRCHGLSLGAACRRGDSKEGGDQEDNIAAVPVDLIKNRRPFNCSHSGCGKTFKNPQTLKMHYKTHCSDERYLAGESSSYPGAHPRAAGHNRKIPSRCPVCRRIFVGLYELRRHFGRKHSEGEKMYGCRKCGKRFYVEVDLRDHEKLCGEPIQCKCGIKFAFKCNLVAHKKNHPQCQDYNHLT